MATVRLSPVFNGQIETAAGIPAAGWTISTYVAGSSTPQATYTDSAGLVPQESVITLNTLGMTDNPIWLIAGQSYKFVLKDENGVTQKTIDNVDGINDASVSVSQWQSSGVSPTYVSATSFSLAGDQTSEFHVGRRLQLTVTAGTVYGVITASAYTTLTTITVSLDSGALDSGLSAVNLSILRADHSAMPTKGYTSIETIGAMTAGGGVNLPAGQGVVFEGTTDDDFEATLSGGDPTADRTLALPDKSGTLAVTSDIKQIAPITASVSGNALTLTLNPCQLDFRSATLGSGTVNQRTVGSAISLVISSGSTMGTVSGQASRIALLAIDNAGTVELAAVNLAGGTNLDETGVISTTAEGGAGAADSATTVYSQTARSNVPYRVVGYVESTQATAGTWATDPSTIQGYGGQALTALQSLGYGQTWTGVTRNPSTTYYNTTGKPITFSAYIAPASTFQLTVSGASLSLVSASSSVGAAVTYVIPAGASYSFTGGALVNAFELR